jgi:hypothetical protein
MSGTIKQKYPELPPEMVLAIFEEFLPHLNPEEVGKSLDGYEALMKEFGQGERCLQASIRAISSKDFRSSLVLLARQPQDPELPQ